MARSSRSTLPSSLRMRCTSSTSRGRAASSTSMVRSGIRSAVSPILRRWSSCVGTRGASRASSPPANPADVTLRASTSTLPSCWPRPMRCFRTRRAGRAERHDARKVGGLLRERRAHPGQVQQEHQRAAQHGAQGTAGRGEAAVGTAALQSWEVDERLGGTDSYTEYRAFNSYAGERSGHVLLRVYAADPYLPSAERAQQRTRIANAYNALNHMPGSSRHRRRPGLLRDRGRGPLRPCHRGRPRPGTPLPY